MEKTAVLFGVVLLASCVLAFPKSGAQWRRETEEDVDRGVEVVQPSRSGSPRRPEVSIVPLGVSYGGLGGLGGLAGLGGLSGFSGLGGFRPVSRVGAVADGDSDEDDDTGPGGFLPSGFLHPFMDPMSNFMSQMAEMMTAMRRQMNQVLERLPAEGQDWSKLGNTTSTTKVIDGHVVTVNDTTITKDDGEDSESVIHIRVVDVHPSEGPDTAAQDGDDNKDAESPTEAGVAKGTEQGDKHGEQTNEIPKSQQFEKRAGRVARQAPYAVRGRARGDIVIANQDAAYADDDDDETDDVQQHQMPVFEEDDSQQHQMPVYEADDSQQVVQVPLFESADDDQQSTQQQQQKQQKEQRQQHTSSSQQRGQLRLPPSDGSLQTHADLSRDTLVNALLEQQHARAGLIMVDPDAELMDVRDGKVVGTYSPNDSNRRSRRTFARRPY